MTTKHKSVRTLAATLITIGILAGGANAAVTINLWQDGLNVRGQAAGTLNVTGMLFQGTFAVLSDFRIQPNDPEVLFFGPGDLYRGIVSFPDFGTGTLNTSGTSTGDHFGFEGANLVVPSGFVWGSSIFSEGVFLNASLASLGASLGSYVYTLPNDTINLVVGSAPIPEPSSALLVGLSTLCLVAHRRKK